MELKLGKIKLTNYGITYEIDVANMIQKTIIQDLKVLIFGEYVINEDNTYKLEMRKSPIQADNIPSDIDEVILMVDNQIIGTARITSENNKRVMYVKEIKIGDSLTNKIDDLFELIEEHDIDDYCSKDNYGDNIWQHCKGKDKLKKLKYDSNNLKNIKDKYLSGLFKIYYDSIMYSSFMNSLPRIEGKASAMASYIAIKNYLNYYFKKEKLDLTVSHPNVFIKNINKEFDALVIKGNKADEYFYDYDDVKTIIEIKSSGFFSAKADLIRSYHTKDDDTPQEDAFIDYITDYEKDLTNKQQKIQYIYLSIYESFGQRNTSTHYYEFLLANLLHLDDDKYVGIFCGLKSDSNRYLIPYEYDIEKILGKIYFNK